MFKIFNLIDEYVIENSWEILLTIKDIDWEKNYEIIFHCLLKIRSKINVNNENTNIEDECKLDHILNYLLRFTKIKDKNNLLTIINLILKIFIKFSFFDENIDWFYKNRKYFYGIFEFYEEDKQENILKIINCFVKDKKLFTYQDEQFIRFLNNFQITTQSDNVQKQINFFFSSFYTLLYRNTLAKNIRLIKRKLPGNIKFLLILILFSF